MNAQMNRHAKRAGILILMVISFVYGLAVGRYRVFPFGQLQTVYRLVRPAPESDAEQVDLEHRYYGRWYALRRDGAGDAARREALEKLETLPYLQGYNPSKSDSSGVVTRDERAFDGATLFATGHAPVVHLVDMAGNILHTWSITFDQVWPDSVPFPIRQEHAEFIRRAHVYPNGDLLALFEYIGVVKLDRNSKLLWRYTGRNHHDLCVAPGGNVYTLGQERRAVPQNYPFAKESILDDTIVVLDDAGNEVDKLSVFDAFYRSDFAGYLDVASRGFDDVFHTNSVQYIERPSPRGALFEEGDLLISMRNIDTIALVDGEEKTVKWAMSGMWRAQHQAVLLDNGNILLLDNQGANRDAYFEFDRSRVIELDPATQQIVWEYGPDDTGDDVFFTHWLGYNQRLPNGNTLITESTQGHIFEVTPGKEIVWEFYNPNRTGENNELIATVMGATRLDIASLEFLESSTP